MKKIISGVVILIIIILVVLARLFLIQPNEHPELNQEQFEEYFPNSILPQFSEAPANGIHQINDGPPFVGSALIDIDNDGIDEVFVGGGKGQADSLLKFQNGGLLNILPPSPDLSEKEASLGAISIDADYDGDTDIIIARPDDLHLLINEGGSFQQAQLNLKFSEHLHPFSVAAGDINKDGLIDLYVSTFISMERFKGATFNDPDHKTENIFLLGDKERGFQDITESSGVRFSQNTFLSSFVDLDNDGWQDLVIAPNTDRVRVYKNLQDNTFLEMDPITEYGFWMGLAVADIDHDGDQDLFFSNSGNTLPDYISQGDLREDQKKDTDWALLLNEGDFRFVRQDLDNYEFSWGAVFADLNLDGSAELIVAENYAKWLAHKISPLPGRILMLAENNRWHPIIELSGAVNPHFGSAALVSDFNQDGYPDIVYVNVDGPVKAYLNQGGDNHFIKVTIPDTGTAIGTTVSVEMEGGEVFKQTLHNSSGFLSDQSSTLLFGLGNQSEINQLTIDWPSGKQSLRKDVEADTQIFIEEK